MAASDMADLTPDPALHWLAFGDLLRENRRRYRSAVAVVCGDTRMSYADLDDRVNRLACALRASGVGQGDRLAWVGQNCHRVLELFFAAAKLGAALCPINWRLSADEMAFILDDLEPSFVFWHEEEIGDCVRAGRDACSIVATWIQVDGDEDASYESFLASSASDDDEAPIDPASPLLVIYTAAFGGRPHGALLHHAGLLATAVVRGFASEITQDTVYLNATNFYHVGNWDFGTLPTVVFGGSNVVLRRWDAREAARLVEAEKVTLAFMAGPMYEAIQQVAESEGSDISTLLPPSFIRNKVGGYGQTELHGVQTFSAWAPGEGSHGRSSPFAQVRLFDDNGVEVAHGEVGEIAVRGPVVMAGYHRRAELNERCLAGGWRLTNDLARREPDGSLSFIGPKTRMLKSGAENIYPVEVERTIELHPAVRRCAVIGAPDEQWDQVVVAILELHDGADVTLDEIIDHCRARMASYKKPRRIEVVTELPAENGRILYDVLDAHFGGGGYPGHQARAIPS